MNEITETATVSRAEDGALVVQIDTHEGTGRVRVWLNDGALYDGDPERDEAPQARTLANAPHTDGWKWHPMPLSDHAPIATTTDLRPGMDAPVPDGEYLAAGTGDDGIALVVTVGVLRGRVVTLWAAVS